MSKDKKKKRLPEGYLAVYRPHLLTQVIALTFLVFSLVWLTSSLSNPATQYRNIIDALPFLLFFTLMLWGPFMLVSRSKLIITEEGLIWQHHGSRQESSWENLSHFEGKSSFKMENIKCEDGRDIPLHIYTGILITARPGGSYFWERSSRIKEIRAYLNEYAPHLFADLDTKKKKLSADDSAYDDIPALDLQSDASNRTAQKQ